MRIMSFDKIKLVGALDSPQNGPAKPGMTLEDFPDVGLLKTQQREAFERMLEYVEGRSPHKMFLLKGFAGTGKTFTITTLVKYLMEKQPCAIAMTAPTNKAVRVLAKMASYKHDRLNYRTIYSLLGLKPVVDGFGNQEFKRDFNSPASVEEQRILIVDEVSQLEDSLFEMLVPYVQKGLKIIFMGDPYQIPPVNKEDCIPLSEAGQQKYEIGVAVLEEVVRQAADNPIIAATMVIRGKMMSPDPLFSEKTHLLPDGRGMMVLEKSQGGTAALLEMIETLFLSEEYQQDPDAVKILAWTNEAVRKMNSIVRRIIYPDSQQKIEIGERLLAQNAVFDGDDILLTTNEECEVVDYVVKEDIVNGGQLVIKFYQARVRSFDRPEHECSIKIIHEESEKTYDTILDLLLKTAKNKQQGSFQAKQAWIEYYGFMKLYADMVYNYALTAHRSQGSTYGTTIVLSENIRANKKVFERNRILYTACSRPKNLLVLLRN